MKTANWMNHLEYDWESPVWQVLRRLATDYTLIRYDARGNGMSDWDVDELSLDAWVSDLEAVVDAVGVERFPLFGMSRAAPYPLPMLCAIPTAYHILSYTAGSLLAANDARRRRMNGATRWRP